MKNLITHTLTPLFFAVLLFAGTAGAQFAPRIIQVKVPFDFTVGQKAFPAGQYTLVSMAQHRVDLRDKYGSVFATLITHSVRSLDKSASTKLTFSTAGGGRALTQIWIEGDLIGDELAPPKRPVALGKATQRAPVEVGSGGNQ